MTHPADFRALCAELVKRLDRRAMKSREEFELIDRASVLLAAQQQGALSDEEIRQVLHLYGIFRVDEGDNAVVGYTRSVPEDQVIYAIRNVLTRYGAQAVPVAVADVRYEFTVYDADTDEPQAAGAAPTLEDAQREGHHYFAMYSEDGPMRLELRRVEVLPLPEAQS